VSQYLRAVLAGTAALGLGVSEIHAQAPATNSNPPPPAAAPAATGQPPVVIEQKPATPAPAEAAAPAPAPANRGAAPAASTASQPATPPASDQINIKPVDVTASKPKPKPVKETKAEPGPVVKAAPSPVKVNPQATNTAGGSGAGAGSDAPAGPVKIQDQTKLGSLTPATPLNGTVIDKQDLETIQPLDTQRELLRVYPGVSMVRNIRIPVGGKGYTNNLTDGMATRSASLGTFGYLDEVNLFDVQRVELTRGPASVLYPSKGFGGTINVVTKDPPREQVRSIFADYGMYGYARLGAGLAGTEQATGIGYLVSANHLTNDGWRDRTKQEKDAGSLKLVFHPDDITTITTRGEILHQYIEHAGVLSQVQYDQNWRQAQFKNLYEDKMFFTGSIDAKRKVGDGGELQVAYAAHNNRGDDGCPSGCSSSAASTSMVHINYTTNNFRAAYRQDFDFLASRFYFGMDAFLSDKRDDTWARAQDSFVLTTRGKAYTVYEKTLAPFAQYEFSPLPGLRFTLGARFEDYSLSVDDRSPTTNKDGDKHYNDMTRQVAATYELAPNHRVWGRIARSFFVPDTGSTVTGDNAKPLEPEIALTYDMGLRGQFSKMLGYDVAYYHTDIANFSQGIACPNQATCPDSTLANINAGRATYPLAGDAKFRGVETGVWTRPFDFVRLDAAHTYALNNYVRYVERNVDYARNELLYSPKHHINGRVTVYPLPGLEVQFQADYYSSYFLNQYNSADYQRPILYTLRTAYHVNDKVELWAHALNLLDTKYGDRVGANNVANPQQIGRNYYEGATPLTVRTGVRLTW
jgi:outer membrane receptor protein involved in Fe transport